MQKKFIFTYLLIVVTLLILLSLSRAATEKTRGNFVALLAPIWEKLASIRSHDSSERYAHENGMNLSSQEEIQRLILENKLLTNELVFAGKLIEDKQLLDRQMQNLEALPQADASLLQTSYQSYVQRLQKRIKYKLQALPARIIFRTIGTWNNAFWINIGEADNISDSPKIVAKNSPVLAGNAVVGIIDYVGKHQSRVCLITDPSFTPSVRATRGGEQDAAVGDQIESLIIALKYKKSLTISENDRQALLALLKQTKETLQPAKKSWYLAKGELQGSLHSSSRIQNQALKGTGFNYDFTDEEGGARDLRSGQFAGKSDKASMPLLKLNDILVTTGFDGVLPPNLPVAIITKINLLKEGDFYYELEAKPLAGNLNELSFVLVIPPINAEESSFAIQN